MAVRKRADAPPATEEELEVKKLMASMARESVIKECLKGLIAFPLVIAGGSLVWWCSKLNGSIIWFAGITGLVIVAVGFSLAEGFIESLMNKNLAKGIGVLIRESAMKFQMKEWMKAFLGFLSITGGIGLVVTAWEQADYYVPEWALYCVGILLFTGGVTYFWTRSKFHKG